MGGHVPGRMLIHEYIVAVRAAQCPGQETLLRDCEHGQIRRFGVGEEAAAADVAGRREAGPQRRQEHETAGGGEGRKGGRRRRRRRKVALRGITSS